MPSICHGCITTLSGFLFSTDLVTGSINVKLAQGQTIVGENINKTKSSWGKFIGA